MSSQRVLIICKTVHIKYGTTFPGNYGWLKLSKIYFQKLIFVRERIMGLSKRCLSVFMSLAFVLSSTVLAAAKIVEDGKPNAEIVVSKDAPRMARFASLELQYYLQKMSGARLPIVFEKTAAENIKIYVGKSICTEEIGIDDNIFLIRIPH